MLFNKKIAGTIVVSTLCMLVSACSNDDSSSGIPYKGKTTPATITETNAKTITVESMNGSSTSGVDKIFGVVTESPESHVSTVGIAKILAHSVAAIHADPNAGYPMLSGVTQSQSQTVNGSCGGTVTLSGAGTGGTAKFTNFCDAGDFNTSGLTFNGTMSVAVEGDPATTSGPVKVTITIGSFTAKGTVGTEKVDVSMSGSIAMEMASTDMTMTMSFVSQDNLTGEQAKTENLKIAMKSTGFSIDGRVYLSTDGYVDIVTVTPINITFLNSTPSAGEISFTGANSTKAVLKITGTGTYTVTFNGTVVDSGNWSDLGVQTI